MVLRAYVPVAVALLKSGRSRCDGYRPLQFHGSRSLSAGLWPRCFQLFLNAWFPPGYHLAGFRPSHIVLVLVRPRRITAPPFRLSARPPHVSCLSINHLTVFRKRSSLRTCPTSCHLVGCSNISSSVLACARSPSNAAPASCDQLCSSCVPDAGPQLAALHWFPIMSSHVVAG